MAPLADAFDYFGACRKNPRWSWSGRSLDGETVVLTLWKDQITDLKQRPVVCDNYGKNVHLWTKKPGNRERIENLIWARDHCNARFRVILVTARDEHKQPRTIKDCYPDPHLVMQLTDLDEETGEFCAESVSG